MNKWLAAWVALAAAWASPLQAWQAPHEGATPPTVVAVPDMDAEVDRAVALIDAHKPAEAMAVLDALNAATDRIYAGEAKQVYCARSPAETVLYSGMAAKEKKAAVVTREAYCYGIFLKGFVLIDLNRSDEARPWLERAIALAPYNAHF